MESRSGPSGDSARIVYRDLLRFGARPRTQLAVRSGLSMPTVTRACRELIESGWVRELPPVPIGTGRPQEPLEVEVDDGPRFIGVKITATEVHAAVTTVRAHLLEELRLPLAGTGADQVIASIQTLTEPLLEAHPRVATIGVSLAGRVENRSRVLSSGLLGWDHPVDLAVRLEEACELPVVVCNDLLALLSAVHWFGVGRELNSFALITVGAGVATGIVHHDQVVIGHHHAAGLTERLPVGSDENGDTVTAGQALRTSALLAAASRRGLPVAGPAGLAEAAAAGNPVAQEVLQEASMALVRACAAVMALVDPEAVVLGGETAAIIRGEAETFEAALREHLAPAQQSVRVRMLAEDFDEWARGAAVIAVQHWLGMS